MGSTLTAKNDHHSRPETRQDVMRKLVTAQEAENKRLEEMRRKRPFLMERILRFIFERPSKT